MYVWIRIMNRSPVAVLLLVGGCLPQMAHVWLPSNATSAALQKRIRRLHEASKAIMSLLLPFIRIFKSGLSSGGWWLHVESVLNLRLFDMDLEFYR